MEMENRLVISRGQEHGVGEEGGCGYKRGNMMNPFDDGTVVS